MRFHHTLLALLCLAPAAAAELPSARWEGVIPIPRRDVPIVLDLAKNQAGAWTGSVILQGLGIKGLALTEIVVKDGDASCTLPDTFVDAPNGPAKLKARLQPDGKLAAEFSQGGNTASFVLEKTGPAQVETSPTSTPVAAEFQGEWKGEYELFGYPRKVTLKLTNPPSGPVAADFLIVGKKNNQVPVSLLIQKGDFVSLEAKTFGITYEGRLKPGSNEIRGTFTQGAFELPLVLRRTP